MQLFDERLIFSPSDIVNHLACEHLTQLNLLVARRELDRPVDDRSEAELIRNLGLTHEAAYLQDLKAQGLSVVEIPGCSSAKELQQAHTATVEAMQAGVDVIFQATFFDGSWRGHADFLFRSNHLNTDLGPFGYEPYDTKLARTLKVSALVQLADYAAQLEAIQGVRPQRVHIVLGNREISSFATHDVAAFHRRARLRLIAATEPIDLASETYPDPVSHCGICPWNEVCEQRRKTDDHLSRVAGLGKPQIKSLAGVGITTVQGLAEAVEGKGPPRMLAATYERLRHQAQLQATTAVDEPRFELVDPALNPAGGFRLLPEPSAGDLFFDLEGDPYRGDDGSGLEYLWGVSNASDDFSSWWAHDSDAELVAFENIVDFFIDCLARDPKMHVYHYADYEVSVMKRLASRHASREEEVDHLLRNEVFVDLYAVARHAVRISKSSLSIKDLEVFYRDARETDVQSGMASVVEYEKWIEAPDQAILDDIEAYNRDDCLSTHGLREWLELQRSDAETRWGTIERRPVEEVLRGEEANERSARVAQLRVELLADIAQGQDARSDSEQGQWLLAHLLEWHKRETKPSWWRLFTQRAMSPEDLWHDSEAVAALSYEGEVGSVSRSLLHHFSFDPEQPHKLKPHSMMDDHAPNDVGSHKSVKIEMVDAAAGWLTIKRGKTNTNPLPNNLIPGKPMNTDLLQDAIEEVGQSWLTNSPSDEDRGEFPAIRDLLTRALPRTTAAKPLRLAGESASDAVIRVAGELDESYLAVQGPPGTGKTFTGAHMIKALVAAGKRVGVVANSHRVVENLFEKLAEVAPDLAMLKVGSQNPEIAGVKWTKQSSDGAEALHVGDVEVIGGTAWLFARTDMRHAIDVLVIDEAGQFSLAHTIAAATSAKNLVLLGDPQQLDQPVQGSHQPGTSASALAHVCGDAQTINEAQGVFLDTTWRMPASVCSFVSDTFYQERLSVEPHAPARSIDEIAAGLYWVPVPHQGCSGRSFEEAARVADLVTSALGSTLRVEGKPPRPVTPADVLVITPFNAQVQTIREALAAQGHDDVLVGTVDLFQGREAPVVIYPMTSSSADAAPRGINFLFSTNRFNVALSRAQVAAFVVASPALLDTNCAHPEQLPLVGALCGFVEACAGSPTRG